MRATHPAAGPVRHPHLSPREWVVVLVVVSCAALAMPRLWAMAEPIDERADFRMPDRSSDDYYLFARHAVRAVEQGQTVVLGDSVIWGRYVNEAGTLTHHLNERTGQPRYANLAINGAHPMALLGLVTHHGRAIRDCDVIVHLNLSWLASPEADLQRGRDARINHPRLVPQFDSRLGGYQASAAVRLSAVIERHLALFTWARHLEQQYFDHAGFPAWSVRRALEDRARDKAASGGTPVAPQAAAWTARDARVRSVPWVAADSSLQWEAFQRLVGLLRARGNQVFVVIGPINEHMLAAESLARYWALLARVEECFRRNRVPFRSARLLDRDQYADLSHPLASGYARLAEEIGQTRRVAPRRGTLPGEPIAEEELLAEAGDPARLMRI